ncbi:MAG TPA: hypothetical protein VGA13_04795 [Acidimicrobiales bacterium]
MIERGVIVGFDPDRGIGEVAGSYGGRHPFHCTAIADGSRSIEAGTEVVFTLEPGRMGEWEATDISSR